MVLCRHLLRCRALRAKAIEAEKGAALHGSFSSLQDIATRPGGIIISSSAARTEVWCVARKEREAPMKYELVYFLVDDQVGAARGCHQGSFGNGQDSRRSISSLVFSSHSSLRSLFHYASLYDDAPLPSQASAAFGRRALALKRVPFQRSESTMATWRGPHQGSGYAMIPRFPPKKTGSPSRGEAL
jgi:hypothetical protein